VVTLRKGAGGRCAQDQGLPGRFVTDDWRPLTIVASDLPPGSAWWGRTRPRSVCPILSPRIRSTQRCSANEFRDCLRQSFRNFMSQTSSIHASRSVLSRQGPLAGLTVQGPARTATDPVVMDNNYPRLLSWTATASSGISVTNASRERKPAESISPRLEWGRSAAANAGRRNSMLSMRIFKNGRTKQLSRLFEVLSDGQRSIFFTGRLRGYGLRKSLRAFRSVWRTAPPTSIFLQKNGGRDSAALPEL